MLPLSDQEPIGYFSGIVGGVVGIAFLFLLARRRAPLDHRNAPDFRNPGTETAGLLAWMAAVLAVGSVFDIRTHIAFAGLAPGAQAVWDQHALHFMQHRREIGQIDYRVGGENEIGTGIRFGPQTVQHVGDIELRIEASAASLLDHARRQIDTAEMIDLPGEFSGG